jgi:hypothetical protein
MIVDVIVTKLFSSFPDEDAKLARMFVLYSSYQPGSNVIKLFWMKFKNASDKVECLFLTDLSSLV